MAPVGSAASDTDAQHNRRCTGYVGQPTEKPQRGTRVRLLSRLTRLLRTPHPRQPGGRGSGGVGVGGSWAGWAGRRRGCCIAFTQLLPPASSQSEWSLRQLRRAAGAGAQRSSAQRAAPSVRKAD